MLNSRFWKCQNREFKILENQDFRNTKILNSITILEMQKWVSRKLRPQTTKTQTTKNSDLENSDHENSDQENSDLENSDPL